MPQLIWSHFAEPIESRPALAITPPASGELTLETTPLVRSDCDLTLAPRATHLRAQLSARYDGQASRLPQRRGGNPSLPSAAFRTDAHRVNPLHFVSPLNLLNSLTS
jgi:hypothetical protein